MVASQEKSRLFPYPLEAKSDTHAELRTVGYILALLSQDRPITDLNRAPLDKTHHRIAEIEAQVHGTDVVNFDDGAGVKCKVVLPVIPGWDVWNGASFRYPTKQPVPDDQNTRSGLSEQTDPLSGKTDF